MSYVRNAWYVASWADEIVAEKPVGLRILGDPIVLWRAADGSLSALADRCVHRLAPLSLGRCEGHRLRCMYHGLLFDPDGCVVEIPGQDMIPAQARVRGYPVVERHSWIWVWMGDAADADEALIPPAVGLDDPDWVLGHGQLDYAAEARLINDNLLDFSHLSFVHANSFGASETWARERPRITALDRGIRYERWIENEGPMRGTDLPGGVDGWTSYDFLVPGILLMGSAQYPAGTARRFDHAAPPADLPAIGRTFTSQAVTPLTDRTSRYFFSWGPHRTAGDEAMRDMLMGIAAMAFNEDKVMIEAQQRVIDGTAAPQVMPTTGDKALILFNRLVERLARDEARAGNAALQAAE
ncbi:MAG TPA: aromatic ring-hydroxylating dioxygenase subunit alpha [Sphingomonas sp.]|nr:aromatic ring-hydroxylating dioxygenase subunit alpha [Sphingomonas sp.]